MSEEKVGIMPTLFLSTERFRKIALNCEYSVTGTKQVKVFTPKDCQFVYLV